LTLSLKNNWQDENGNVYVILTRKRAQLLLNLSDKTATKAFKELNTFKLIVEKKQGQTKPNLIYVGKIEHDENLTNLIRKNYGSRNVKTSTQESENLRPNYNNKNNNNRTNKPNSYLNYSQRHYAFLTFRPKALLSESQTPT
ncbi:MAG: replication initiator protein A, partial [Bacteroidaceae bacterium]|nr:replication initiator protein A [Bacteroidaceae bacterium]